MSKATLGGQQMCPRHQRREAGAACHPGGPGATAGAAAGRGPRDEGPGLTPGLPSAAPSRWAPSRAPPASTPRAPALPLRPLSTGAGGSALLPTPRGAHVSESKSSLPCSEQTASHLGTSALCPFLYRPGSAWADRGPRTVPAFSSVAHSQVRPRQASRTSWSERAPLTAHPQLE